MIYLKSIRSQVLRGRFLLFTCRFELTLVDERDFLLGFADMTRRLKKLQGLENLSMKFTESIGTPMSILIHTILFIGIFALKFFGVDFENILLILTTLVSLEAIYLAIFIQMTVNRNTQALEGVEENIEEIQEDVEDIQEDVGEIEGDVDVIHAGVKEISVDVEEISKDVDELGEEVEEISEDIDKLQEDPGELNEDQVRDMSLDKIEHQLLLIMKELEELKKKTS